MGKYTMDDIDTFLVDYFGTVNKDAEDWMFSIPIVGQKVWETTFLENMKKRKFGELYEKALSGTPEEQEKFIEQMTPILDDYYKTKKSSRSR